MKVEVAVLGSLSLLVLRVSVDVKQHSTMSTPSTQELCEMVALGSQSLIVHMVSEDVKQHSTTVVSFSRKSSITFTKLLTIS